MVSHETGLENLMSLENMRQFIIYFFKFVCKLSQMLYSHILKTLRIDLSLLRKLKQLTEFGMMGQNMKMK